MKSRRCIQIKFFDESNENIFSSALQLWKDCPNRDSCAFSFKINEKK